ncbi:hypothetical protein PENFLA_c059G09992 [Penicillium flavigenum]|uniref:ATP synthase subunit f, mitochondrial n=1 Tax=Penicillium flavigenum TaxID=254877 RepID=A0A1V6SGN8_9EURO|nr:hypothetical protein PENFLA_c059G09992 [Penicillium flavigenum]
MVVASEDSLQVWFGCELQAGHDTTESGLAGLGKPNTRRARFVPPSSSISFLWFTCAANQHKMSYIARRGLSTLIPPKVASPNVSYPRAAIFDFVHPFHTRSAPKPFFAIGAAQDAARMERVVTFYAGLPRGPAAPVKPTGLIGRYQARYFSGKNASGVPLVHAIGGILILGYSMEYYFHLRHHKNHPH